jgi:hypothetical protein
MSFVDILRDTNIKSMALCDVTPCTLADAEVIIYCLFVFIYLFICYYCWFFVSEEPVASIFRAGEIFYILKM